MDLTTLPGYVPGFRDTLGLRDLGGLASADGRLVRRGLLYRGSSLVRLDEGELRRLDELGLRFVLDLRASGEAQGQDDYVPDGAEYLRISGMYDRQGREADFSPAGITRITEQIADHPETFMRDLYCSMMFDNPAVHALVEHMVAGQAPLYFHCTAGKDRTGVCAAVLLTLLGVPDERIVWEFLLTNTYRADIINNMPDDLPPHLQGADSEHWAKVNSVNEGDLRAALAAVDERYPTREAYFAQEFGLDAAALAALRDRYLA